MFRKVGSREGQSIQSRVAWSAIFAGLLVALASLVFLTMSLTALRLSFVGVGQSSWGDYGLATQIAQTVIVFLSLFLGGWASSRLVERESHLEAMIGGIIVWVIMFGALLLLRATGVSLSAGSVMGVNMLLAHYLSAVELQNMVQAMDLSPEQFTMVVEDFQLSSPAITAMTWLSLGGLVGSLLSAIGGAWVGSLAYHVPREASGEALRSRVIPLHRSRPSERRLPS